MNVYVVKFFSYSFQTRGLSSDIGQRMSREMRAMVEQNMGQDVL